MIAPPFDTLALFKLTVTPALVGLASLAARRWGNTVAGLIAGLPLMTAPISVFLAIEQGAAFTVGATTGIFIALAAISLYGLTYTVTARFAPWPIAIATAYAAFFLAAWQLQPLIDGFWPAAAAAYAALFLGIILVPRHRNREQPPRIPWWEIWLRMLATALMIAFVTGSATLFGAKWTGIIAAIPVLATVMATFTHARWGAAAAIRFMRSMMLSLIAFATFFVVVALGLETYGIVKTYAAATVVALIVSPAVAALDRWLAHALAASRPTPPPAETKA